MSFDPQNPRGAPRPSAPPTPSYIPPQPVERRPPTALLAAIAILALVVLVAAVYLIFNGGGPPSSPGPTQRASTSASTVAATPANSQAPRTGAPTTGASLLPPTPRGSPTTAYEAFLLHVPDAIRPSCAQNATTDPAIEFSAQCATTDGIVVIYDEYGSADAMNAAYQAEFASIHIDANSGSCEDHATWPAESTYDVNGAPAGHRLCADVAGAPTITWTDDQLGILSVATGSAADAPGLIAFWTNEAGPIP